MQKFTRAYKGRQNTDVVVLLRTALIVSVFALLFISLFTVHSPIPLRILLYFFLLETLAEALPVTGPRGRRISVSEGLGLASLLLIPPSLAPLPFLIVGGLHTIFQQTRASQRETLCTTLSLSAAVFIGSLQFHAGGLWWSLSTYAALLIGYKFLFQHLSQRDLFLDIGALIACAIPALLMVHLWPIWGLLGMLVTAALLGFLLLLAHLAYESVRLRAQVRAMERLSEITIAQDNLPRLIARFLHLGGELVSSDRAAFWVSDNANLCLEQMPRMRIGAGEHFLTRSNQKNAAKPVVRYDEGLVGRVAQRQLPLIVQDIATDLRPAAVERLEWPQISFSVLLLPLVAAGETIGVVQFERDDPQPYTHRDITRVRAITGQAATAIVNAQRHRAISDQAVTDGLTGLFIRRHIQATLESEERRALRYGHSLAVIMLDIDFFKSYNDTYGHTQGDVLIRMVASVLRANVRATDIVGRYGGEEFIVLMPETVKEEAEFTAERLRQAVATTVFPGFADDPEAAVFKTISLGLAALPSDAHDAQMLVTTADQALYEAKRNGRNRVASAKSVDEPVQSIS